MAPYVSIVIPAYNEARRLPSTLRDLERFMAGASWPMEVIIVVERSTDGTLEIAREHATQQVQSRHSLSAIDNGPQRGKGYAVRSGVLQAAGDLIFYMDVDLSVPVETVGGFVREFERDAATEVLIGNRQHPGSRITRAQGWLRRSMGQTFNRILGTLSLAPFPDTQCGFKAFRRDAAQAIFTRQRLNGFAFDVEVLLIAEGLGMKVADLPVEWINSDESKVHIVRDSLRMLRDTAKVRRLVRQTLGRERMNSVTRVGE